MQHKQCVLGLFWTLICLYPFSNLKTHFLKVPMRLLTKSHIHILFTLLIKKLPYNRYTRTNLYIFLWYPKSKLKKKKFSFEILNLKKSVCLNKWRLNLKQRIKSCFCNTHSLLFFNSRKVPCKQIYNF